MKFISKSSNLLIVLKPGLPAQPITGTPPTPTVSVRFKDGLAEVSDQVLADMMLRHAAYNVDFISAEEVQGIDPYAFMREDTEPAHVMTEMKFGTPMGRTVSESRNKLPPAVAKLVQEEAVRMAKEILPGLLEETLKSLVKANDADKAVKSTPKAAAKTKNKPAATVSADPRLVEESA